MRKITSILDFKIYVSWPTIFSVWDFIVWKNDPKAKLNMNWLVFAYLE